MIYRRVNCSTIVALQAWLTECVAPKTILVEVCQHLTRLLLISARPDCRGRGAQRSETIMATKLLSTSELSAATYGKFSRSGVRVDLHGFFGSVTGKRLISELRDSSGSKTGKSLSGKRETKAK